MAASRSSDDPNNLPGASELTPEQAQALLSQNNHNLAYKLKRGGTLTLREREILMATVEGKSSNQWASNRVLLAKMLGVERELLYVVMVKAKELAKQGKKVPARRANGQYLVSEWRDFANANLDRKRIPVPADGSQGAHGVNGEEAGYVTRKERLVLEKLEVELANEKRESEILDKIWIKKEDAKSEVMRCNEQVRNELTRRFRISAPAEYAQVQGDPDECRAINERHLQEIFEYLHSGEWAL